MSFYEDLLVLVMWLITDDGVRFGFKTIDSDDSKHYHETKGQLVLVMSLISKRYIYVRLSDRDYADQCEHQTSPREMKRQLVLVTCV